jgi:uncharacterized protein YecE (DUF72 family)
MHSPLRIGTAGWNVPSRHAQHVSTGETHLERYARTLNAAEINSSFYRPHQRKTYERWASSTPDDFRFAVKMPKAMSHELRLKNCDALLDRFVAETSGLGKKLGVLLLQLPPTLGFGEAAAGRFFQELKSRTGTQVALEPRHANWFALDIESWLIERQIARVAADPAPAQGAGEPGGWRGLAYFRWHGAPKIYYSDYGETSLATLAKRLDKSVASGAGTWCIFDNTALGAAFGNALSMKEKGPGIL